MKPQNNIKIIKREQRESMPETTSADAKSRQSLPRATREAAGNVAVWVKEFQQRRKPNPRLAFANLFAAPLNSMS